MVATAVLRGEERVSREACTFLFFVGTVVSPLLYVILIYRQLLLTYQLVVSCVIAWRTFLFSDFFLPAFSEKKMLLYLVLGPLSFDKAS